MNNTLLIQQDNQFSEPHSDMESALMGKLWNDTALK